MVSLMRQITPYIYNNTKQILPNSYYEHRSINLKIEDHTKEMMENSFTKRELKVDIQDIKIIKTNKTWTQPKSDVKLSLGAIPTHQFENSW